MPPRRHLKWHGRMGYTDGPCLTISSWQPSCFLQSDCGPQGPYALLIFTNSWELPNDLHLSKHTCFYISAVTSLQNSLLFMLKQVLKKHQMSSPMILQFLDNLSLVQQGLNKSLFYSLYSIDRLGSVYPLCMFQAATSERFKNKNKPRNVWLWVAFHCRDFLFTTAHSQKVNLVGILHERTLP